MTLTQYKPEDAVRLAKKAVSAKLRGGRFESNFSEIEDLIQDTLLAFLQYCRRNQEIRDYANLMYGIAENVVKAALRKKRCDSELTHSLQRLYNDRIPLIVTAFPMEEIQRLRNDLTRADARVIDFIIENPDVSAEDLIRQMGITKQAYQASFYRIRNYSWSMRQSHALSYIRSVTELTPSALRKVWSFTQCDEERLEFSAALGIHSRIHLVLDRVQYGDILSRGDEAENTAVQMMNDLIQRIRPRDPGLKLAALDWYLHYHISNWGGITCQRFVPQWIRLAETLVTRDPSITDRFEAYLYYLFEKHAETDLKLFRTILQTFDELSLPTDHPFRRSMQEEYYRASRPKWCGSDPNFGSYEGLQEGASGSRKFS